MLHVENEIIKKLIFEGNFGLEKESLRINEAGNLSHSKHPFPPHPNIVRDFCENQTEINTPVHKSAKEAVKALHDITALIEQTLAKLPEPELLWPSSNPPYIKNEEDIPIAQFEGEQAAKTAYREYLSDRYGRYKMAFSGIHVNFSFGEELLKADFALSGETDFTEYRNGLYLHLAHRAAAYGWILTAITAASPVLDSSFVEKNKYGENEFNGMASTRCSELGYWNHFSPVFDYSDIRSYAQSIQWYVDNGWIAAPSELYYPVRLKPRGINNLEHLANEGVDHIELRMFDLNPLCESGIDVRDVEFAQLLLIFLAGTAYQPFSQKDQVQAVQNFKNAAHYDLKTVKIVVPGGEVYSVVDAAINVIGFMREFYRGFPKSVTDVLDFEELKFIEPENRYAWQLRKKYEDGFVKTELQHAKQLREYYVNL